MSDQIKKENIEILQRVSELNELIGNNFTFPDDENVNTANQ